MLVNCFLRPSFLEAEEPGKVGVQHPSYHSPDAGCKAKPPRTLVPAPWIMGDLREKSMISSPAPRNAPDTDEDLVPNRLAYGNAQ